MPLEKGRGMVAEPEALDTAPWLSVVLPMRNEAKNVALVTGAVAEACAAFAPFEVICVDDASDDATAAEIEAAAARTGIVRLVRHDRQAGQSAAIHNGVLAARGEVVCTLDGDGQNPPGEIPKLIAHLQGRAFPHDIALIAGQRVGRRDTLSKRLASRAANAIRGTLLRDGTRDTGCGLKLFRRDVYLALPYFDHMHRYLPALFAREGWGIVHQDVAHAPRHAGQSNYANLGRALAGVPDLLGVMWLVWRAKKVHVRDGGEGA